MDGQDTEDSSSRKRGLEAEGSTTTEATDAEESAESALKRAKVLEDNQIQIRVLCETKWVGSIIGKGGVVIKSLRQQTGAHITISDVAPGVHKRIITTKGNVDVVANALHLIADKLAENKRSEFEGGEEENSEVTILLLIPNCQIGGVIGKSGSKINSTRETSGAMVRVSEKMLDNSTEKSVQVTGSSEQVYKALILIGYNVLENADKTARQLYVPAVEEKQHAFPSAGEQMAYVEHYPPVPGYMGGQQNPYMGGHVAPHPPPMGVPHPPYPPHPPAAYPPAPMYGGGGGSEKVVIPIPENLIGFIIGRQGCIINEIRNRSGAVIKISDKVPNASERTITITGSGSVNEIAVAMINEKLSQYTSMF